MSAQVELENSHGLLRFWLLVVIAIHILKTIVPAIVVARVEVLIVKLACLPIDRPGQSAMPEPWPARYLLYTIVVGVRSK